MNHKITIDFIGTKTKLHELSDIVKELSPEYKVGFKESKVTDIEHFEQWHNVEGSHIVNFLSVHFSIDSPFLVFMKGYLIKKGFDYFLKEALFQPFLEWAEKHKEQILPAELVIAYEDITIKIAYSRKNQINAVSGFFLSLSQYIDHIKYSERGDLNMIVAPIFHRNDDYFFGPTDVVKLNEYLLVWGLEYNQRNRCVFFPQNHKWVDRYWWD